MKQRVGSVLEFRTPQHPSLGTNNWGGASPLLARNVPKESLEQKYSRLNTVRTRDEIFPADYVNEIHSTETCASGKRRNKRRGFLLKLIFGRKESNTIRLGSRLKRRLRIPRLDPTNRWPQGPECCLAAIGFNQNRSRWQKLHHFMAWKILQTDHS
ncbi:unnamed protein product [Sphenostylis stenocarpa]|uniref:Uncharacterized protein n=1 Tax=Sphenostylis stenocarpa TaxID=92480 RepID=A0AA86VAI4_9FABA|nr:unnamed protein product [Sphenostylis stenocarpa]